MPPQPPPRTTPASPWRPLVAELRRVVGRERDEHGVLGSINWLCHHMKARGANPNVVRNIIYRDKGTLADKRVLYRILDELWRSRGQPPLRSADLERLLSPSSGQDQEVMRLLGREKRRGYRDFVQAVRAGGFPKLLIVGRPGSGKTLLTDFIQENIELPPPAAERLVRLEFSGTDLAISLARLGSAVGVAHEVMEAKLVKVGSSSAFAVQADAQADVARSILEAARRFEGRQVFLLHVARSLGSQECFGRAPLRLNAPDVPRVPAVEWLWTALFEPLSHLPRVALLVSMTDLPVRVQRRLGPFVSPMRLTPPTANEARRFVRARLPHASAAVHEGIVRRAGRSFEELRTLTLLAEIRNPEADPEAASERSVTRLAKLLDGADGPLRRFLVAVAVLSLPEYPAFAPHELDGLVGLGEGEADDLFSTFLDAVPGDGESVRCFSRELAAALRARLAAGDEDAYRRLHLQAAAQLAEAARREPHGEAATRYLTFLLEGRSWTMLCDWMAAHRMPQALVARMWPLCRQELPAGPDCRRLARHVAAHYVKLGTFEHPDVRDAFGVLAASGDDDLRVWTTLRRAEGLALRGQYDHAQALLASLPATTDPRLLADAAIARAGIERWRGRLREATRLVFEEAPWHLGRADGGAETEAVRVKASLWAGLLHKDRGEFDAALASFDSVPWADDLDAARVAFQRGDVFKRLGHFDRALEALDEAVALARRSDALETEQTRYLARRATIHRRRGDFERSRADFEAAREVLLAPPADVAQAPGTTDAWEREFWLARLEDEEGMLLLATGHFDEAALTFDRNLRRFHRYGEAHNVDATYRILRTTLRLALVYGCRAIGQPLRRPFAVNDALNGDGADLRQARGLYGEVLRRVDDPRLGMMRSTLARDAFLAANLFAPSGAAAVGFAERALAMARYPYDRAQAHAHAAAGALRIPDPRLARAHVAAAQRAADDARAGAVAVERGDVELCAWLVTLDTIAAISLHDVASAALRLADGLAHPDLWPYHGAMLRQVGDALEARGLESWTRAPELAAALRLAGGFDLGRLRLADALAAHWARANSDARNGEPGDPVGSPRGGRVAYPAPGQRRTS